MGLVILSKHESQYENFNTMIDEIATEYRAIGHEVLIAHLCQPGYYTKISKAVDTGNVRCFFTVASFGMDMRSENNLYNLYGLPLISLYYDPIILFHDQLEVPIHRRIVATTCDSDFDYWNKRVVSPVDLRHLPHAACPQVATPWSERRYPLVFAGSGPEDPERIRARWTSFGALACQRLNRILEVWCSYPAAAGRPLARIIDEAIGQDLDLAQPRILAPFFRHMDNYVRMRIRWNSVMALADRPLVVVGERWEALAERCAGRRVQFLQPQTVGDFSALTAQARICLNTITAHHGSHERIFRAMATTTLALTTAAGWYTRHAPADALVAFDPERDDLGALVDDLLAAPARVEAIAEAGNRWFLEHHTWKQRVAVLERWITEKWEP